MSAIAGIIDFQTSLPKGEGLVKAMLASQKHRDDSPPVFACGRGYALGMANKHDAIFVKANEDKWDASRVVSGWVDGVVLDAPRHNARLAQKGYKHPPLCSAVLASSYREWGSSFMNHLEGEFAGAVWDEAERTLVLVRDPYGHKPLHYHWDGRRIIFSSEIKGVLAASLIKPEVDLIALSDFLSMNAIPHPGTMFKGILQVSPGEMIIVSPSGMRKHMYWHAPVTEDHVTSFKDAVAQLESSIRSAVKKRMVKDDTWCFLSGGVDSSAVVSFAAELSSKPVNAVNVSFEDKEFDEYESAKAMADHVGANLHHVTAKPEHFFYMLDTLVGFHDGPFTDTSAYPTYYASKLARNFTDLILTGDGPDQIMGGSSHHVHALNTAIFSKRPMLIRKACSAGASLLKLLRTSPAPSTRTKIERNLYRRSLTPVSAAYEVRSFFPELVKEHLVEKELWAVHKQHDPYRHPEAWFRKAHTMDHINQYLYADIQFYIPDDLMIKVDRMGMAHGLETLSPFQDKDIGALVLPLSGKHKLYRDNNGHISTKHLLRSVCKTRLPAQLLTKRKQGFGIPIHDWLRRGNCRELKEILLDPATLNRGYFSKTAVASFVDAFAQHKTDYFYGAPYAFVALITFEMWQRKYIDSSACAV